MPEFVKLEVEQKPETSKPEATTPVIPNPDVNKSPEPNSGNLFSRYITIEQVYAADFFVATNVKKATANHYLARNGEASELTSGKTIATICVDIEESNDGLIIGILKNDGTFHIGFTYLSSAESYAKSIVTTNTLIEMPL